MIGTKLSREYFLLTWYSYTNSFEVYLYERLWQVPELDNFEENIWKNNSNAKQGILSIKKIARMLVQQSQRLNWTFPIIWHPVTFLHFNLLLKNHSSKLDQTRMWYSSDGPLPKLCPVIFCPTPKICSHGFWLVERLEI